MDLKGQRVVHILLGGKTGKYGTETIVGSQKKDAFERINVKFDTEEKVKSFSYLECFGRYLLFDNVELAKQIEDIQAARSAVHRKRQK